MVCRCLYYTILQGFSGVISISIADAIGLIEVDESLPIVVSVHDSSVIVCCQ